MSKFGSARKLAIECVCGWDHIFCSSKKVGKSFDVNKRFTYAMRSCGQGHLGLKKFSMLMNMPPPITQKNYDKLAVTIKMAVKKVAMESMCDAASEIIAKGNPDNSGIVNTAVSCDRSWQRRGFSSFNGTLTCISMDTGKVLDVSVMTRYFKGCVNIDNTMATNPEKGRTMREKHVCTLNYEGSAPGMEIEGVKRIFNRSIKKHNLRYTEYFGDGDSKGFSAVENVYTDMKVIKKECVGHVQKRV